jgi:hypothetical protein
MPKVPGRPDDRQSAGRPVGEPLELASLVQRSLSETPPRAWWPQLSDREQGDLIRVIFGPVNRPALRHLGHDGEDLQGHVPVDEAGDVRMPPVGPPSQITVPEQGVRVQVGDAESVMQLSRVGRDPVWRIVDADVATRLDTTRKPSEGERQYSQANGSCQYQP